MKRAGLVAAAFAIPLGTSCAFASDLNPLGFYVGAAVGRANDAYTAFGVSDASDTGWKVMTGLRPLPILGAELEYVDFGSASFSTAFGGPLGGGFSGTERAHATGLFAVGYLPIPTPFLDIFAKVGGERTHTTADGTAFCGGPVGVPTCALAELVHVNQTESDFAYGAGAQLKLQSWALRAEYERTDTAIGHPKLLSFGITWTF
jgi:opacity protein-like surface antigen